MDNCDIEDILKSDKAWLVYGNRMLCFANGKWRVVVGGRIFDTTSFTDLRLALKYLTE